MPQFPMPAKPDATMSTQANLTTLSCLVAPFIDYINGRVRELENVEDARSRMLRARLCTIAGLLALAARWCEPEPEPEQSSLHRTT